MNTTFNPATMEAFDPAEKVGLLATVTPDGLPHLTLITTLQAKTPSQMMWGQFTEGTSKKNVRENPHTAFLILTMDRRLWRGKAKYTHAATEGEDYTRFNEKPMFRYNTYFGIHTVHYMDLVEHTGECSLPLGHIVPAALLTRLAKAGAKTGGGETVLNPWSEKLLNRIDALRFLAFVDEDGFPTIVPLLQCQAPDSRRVVFSTLAYKDELKKLRPGMTAVVLALTMQTESVLVRGVFQGFADYRLVELGALDLNWVYNSMPPKMGRIYPPEELRSVVDFHS